MKVYDKRNKRLVVFQEKATPEFWDKHWRLSNLAGRIKAGKNSSFVKRFTSRLLQPGAKILEGGCGIGQNVYGLNFCGYDAYGVDLAQKTIRRVKENFPQLKLFVQDVRKLDFPDNSFHGYWSLGVIEHFEQGYDDVLKEAKRVIKPGGYLFMSFPHMSLLRKLKAGLGLYKSSEHDFRNNDFYQFILDSNQVQADVEKYGFTLCSKHPFDATKGLKDEVS